MDLNVSPYSDQEEFENEIKKLGAENIARLYIIRNSKITNIPYLPNLKRLYCIKCSALIKIPNLPNLEELDCVESNIFHISPMNNLKKIYCRLCPNLRNITGNFPELKILYCRNNEHVEVIGNMENLEALDCSYTNIVFIPHIEKLKRLYCDGCPNLVEIPYLPNLLILYCRYVEKIKFIIIRSNKLYILRYDFYIKNKVFNRNLEINNIDNTIHHFQGKLYQNMYRMYELLL